MEVQRRKQGNDTKRIPFTGHCQVQVVAEVAIGQHVDAASHPHQFSLLMETIQKGAGDPVWLQVSAGEQPFFRCDFQNSLCLGHHLLIFT